MPSYIPSVTTLFRIFSLVSVISISSIAGLLYTYQTKLIYPSGLPPGARQDTTDPSSQDLPFESLWLNTPDGERLQAWYIRRSASEGGPYPTTIVMFQANAGNIAHRLPIASILFKSLQVNVFMLSYRGYGLSTGSPQEKGIKIDAQVALDWVRENCKDQQVVLYGQSLGGAVAIDAAVRNPWVKALILENTFLDIPSLIPSVLPPAKYFTFLCREIWASRSRLPLLSKQVKVLFMAGAKDELVPPEQMKELWRLCKHAQGEDKEWREFEEGTHNDTCLQKGYFATLASFLHRHLNHKTPLSREALSRGYDGKNSTGPLESTIEKQLQAYDDDEDEYEHVRHEDATGLRRRMGGVGAGSAAPADIVDEEIEEIQTDGVRAARLRREL